MEKRQNKIMVTLKLFFKAKQITLKNVLFSALDGTNAMSGKKGGCKGEYDIIYLSTFT